VIGGWRGCAAAVGVALAGCDKAPLIPVEARFARADAAWFAEEETLFFFYEVRAAQGLGPPNQVEARWVTDTTVQDWVPLESLAPVHLHRPVDCGVNGRCGSWSVALPERPRRVDLRLRYHPDGALALPADTRLNVVGPGAPHDHRSLVVYGVFDGENRRVQWRGRHQFPTLRNEEATALGLRRWFAVDDVQAGSAETASVDNPYAYGVACPPGFSPAGLGGVETTDRAAFGPGRLDAAFGGVSTVCAQARVADARGTFESAAWARKNPEVEPAFPALQSPVRSAVSIPFFLGPCGRTISAEHEAMQRQRLLLGDLRTTCTDDWAAPDFVPRLTEALRAAVEAERVAPDSGDLILRIALHRDEAGPARALEEALAALLPAERHRATPRLAGAFVFDSLARGLDDPALEPVTLWCPASLGGGAPTPGASLLSCAILPDLPELDLGPLSVGLLPILAPRPDYLDFIDQYSPRQAGRVLSLDFRVPEFATTSDHVDVGEIGVATFLNGENIPAAPADAFSFCPKGAVLPVVFRSPILQSGLVDDIIAEPCAAGEVPAEVCAQVRSGVVPIEALPVWHNLAGESGYDLGLFWSFPFLLRMEYEAVVAGSVSAFGFSVPFGIGGEGEDFLGAETWLKQQIRLEARLLQCTRFCGHPVFGSEGVYRVRDSFREGYANRCYAPLQPSLPGEAYPRDP